MIINNAELTNLEEKVKKEKVLKLKSSYMIRQD